MKAGRGIQLLVASLLVAVAACSPPVASPPASDPTAGESDLPEGTEADPASEPVDPSLVPSETPIEPGSTPGWTAIRPTDVRSGESFALADFAGRVVVMETMAVWCPLCLDQAREIRQANLRFGDEVVFVSLDVDPNESPDLLREHVVRNGLGWRWAVAPRELARALADGFSPAILNPPSTAIVILDRDQQPHLLRFGIKPAAELIEEIETYLA